MSTAQPRYVRVSNFDSVTQSETWQQLLSQGSHPPCDNSYLLNSNEITFNHFIKSHPELLEHFSGVLRTAWLYNEQICLTHAELFDGVFFTLFGPEEIFRILNLTKFDKAPLVIKGPAQTLSESLIRFEELNRPGSIPHLSLLDSCGIHDGSYSLQQRYTRQPPVHAWNTFTLTKTLATYTEALHDLPRGSLSFVAKRWNQWLLAEEQELLTYEPFEKLTRENLLKALIPTVAQPYESIFLDWAGLGNAEFRALLSTDNRSQAWDLTIPKIVESHAQTGSESALLTKCKSFYTFIYQLAIARQHGTDWISVNESDNEFVQYIASLTQGRRTAKYNNSVQSNLGGSVTEVVEKLPPSEFSSLCYKSAPAIEKWRNRRNLTRRQQARATRDVDYALQQSTTRFDRHADLIRFISTIFLTIVLAIATVALDTAQFSTQWAFVLIPVLSFIITIIPDALTTIQQINTYRGHTKTVMVSYLPTLQNTKKERTANV